MNNRLLIIDDNLEIQEANQEYLTKKGYAVDTAYDGAEALAILREKTYDCIVLDILLPDMDGYAVCKAARKLTDAPVIFLSCMDGEENRIQGLNAGGVDYMTKPYSLKELAARIHAQIRRNEELAHPERKDAAMPSGAMSARNSHALAIGDRKLILSQKEFELLTLLMAKSNETVSKSELLRSTLLEESSLDTYVKRIRGKLAAHDNLGRIETVFGQGYRYSPYDGERVTEAGV